jgi:hypothetical protein
MRQTRSVTESTTSKGTQFTHHPKDSPSEPGGSRMPTGQTNIKKTKTIQHVPEKAATDIHHNIFDAPARFRNKI